MNEAAVIGTVIVHDGNVILRNACTNVDCYWHTNNWHGLYESGCYMLTDAHYCTEKSSGFISIEDGLRKEGWI